MILSRLEEMILGKRHRSAYRIKIRSAPRGDDQNHKLYTAMYRVGDGEATIATFETWEEAEAACIKRVGEVHAGLNINPTKTKMLVRDFVEVYDKQYVPRRIRSKQAVLGTCHKHIVPFLGSRRMEELMDRELLQQFRQHLNDLGLSNDTQRTYTGHLSGFLQTAMLWGYLPVNPVRGLFRFSATPNGDRALKPRQINRLLMALPGPVSELMIDLDVQTGVRWGELVELRVDDIIPIEDDTDENDLGSYFDMGDEDEAEEGQCYVWVRRNLSEINDVDLGRYKIEPTPKNGEWRKVCMGADLSCKMREHIREHRLIGQDLLFTLEMLEAELEMADKHARLGIKVIPRDLGMTSPNAKGRVYRHGTGSAYTAGKCRCEWCQLYYRNYRAIRRADGKDRKKPTGTRAKNLHGHVPGDFFRNKFWKPALSAADIGPARFHDLRHTCATWLAKRGIGISQLKQHMGHKSIVTTERYITMNQKLDLTAAKLMNEIMGRPRMNQKAA
jgi:integrase